MTTDLAAHARSILDTIGFMVLGTADADGRPWTSPVYFAADGLRQFYWLSATDSQHSVNVAARPQVSLVVFDSTVRPYHGSAVYAAGDAHELSGTDLDRALQVYPGPADRGGSTMTLDDVTGSSPYRMYRATASGLWVLCPRDRGQPCALHGIAQDHRAEISGD